jgi:hypothetical protein
VANFYYYDNNGRKIGPIDNAQLKVLAVQGVIVPDTVLEKEDGKQERAGQVKGLVLPVPVPPSVPPPLPPETQQVNRSGCGGCLGRLIGLYLFGIMYKGIKGISYKERADLDWMEWHVTWIACFVLFAGGCCCLLNLNSAVNRYSGILIFTLGVGLIVLSLALLIGYY